MDVFWQGPANTCRQVEIYLISATRFVEGSCNEKPGGEGIRPDRTHECYVYLVLAGAGDGIALQKTRALRSLVTEITNSAEELLEDLTARLEIESEAGKVIDAEDSAAEFESLRQKVCYFARRSECSCGACSEGFDDKGKWRGEVH